jgi:hypothetical protein
LHRDSNNILDTVRYHTSTINQTREATCSFWRAQGERGRYPFKAGPAEVSYARVVWTYPLGIVNTCHWNRSEPRRTRRNEVLRGPTSFLTRWLPGIWTMNVARYENKLVPSNHYVLARLSTALLLR